MRALSILAVVEFARLGRCPRRGCSGLGRDEAALGMLGLGYLDVVSEPHVLGGDRGKPTATDAVAAPFASSPFGRRDPRERCRLTTAEARAIVRIVNDDDQVNHLDALPSQASGDPPPTAAEDRRTDQAPERLLAPAFGEGSPRNASLRDQWLRLYIGGEWRDAADGARFDSMNPSTGAPWTAVAEAGPDDVDRAAHEARTAFDGDWGRVSAADRGRLLWRMAEQIDSHAAALAQLESRDNGKAIRETRAEIAAVVRCFEFFAGVCQGQRGATLPQAGPEFVYTRREPVGVVGAITPWNSPLVMLAWKLCPALAGGNAIILKPAEYTSVTALAFAGLLETLELPAGTVNIVPGKGTRAGVALVEHPGVDKIAFTGSTEVGKAIAAAASKTLKLVTFELGGKSPNIVFADADLEQAVNRASFGIFSAAGQSCQAASRMLVERSVKDAFLERLAAKAESIRIGDALDEATQMGAQVSATQLETIERYVALGISEGGHVVTGGRRPDVDPGGYFYTPTIFDQVDNSMRICREEIFGPVTTLIAFDDEADAIAKANDSDYGLSGAVWTSDVKRAHRVAAALRCGMVWVNTYRTWSPLVPFGGFKQSGYGRENGIEVMEHYTQTKSVWVDLQDTQPDWYEV
jgi:acyl-CoA reductase-like NAD-dependent aldehyde dehydrogenase